MRCARRCGCSPQAGTYVVTGCADAALRAPRRVRRGDARGRRGAGANRRGQEVPWPESSAENPFAALARRCGLASAAADADQRGE